MFIMVHDLELSVGGQVYVGETWTLTTRLQWCSEDMEVIDSIRHVQNRDYLSG